MAYSLNLGEFPGYIYHRAGIHLPILLATPHLFVPTILLIVFISNLTRLWVPGLCV